MTALVKSLLIATSSGSEMISLQHVNVISGKGIEGDRYFSPLGFNDRQRKPDADFEVTLIEQELIDFFNIQTNNHYSGADYRRNIVTQGIDLNALLGKSFTIGNITLKGVSLCEPCAALSQSLGPEIMTLMIHKTGLRAQVISDGLLRTGDEIHTF